MSSLGSKGGAYIPPHRRRQQAPKSAIQKFSPSRIRKLNDRSDGNESVDKDLEVLCGAFDRVRCINLKRRQDRWTAFCSRLTSTLGERGRKFVHQVERFDAVDGAALLASETCTDDTTLLEWDATKNSMYDRHIQPPMKKYLTPGEVGCTMSHVQLWREIKNSEDSSYKMLILEDDATFYRGKQPKKLNRGGRPETGRSGGTGGDRHKPGFIEAFSRLWSLLPSDWHIVYLGFSDRGERIPVRALSAVEKNNGPLEVDVFQPTYGFHTHAYALSASAAEILVSNLPVVGPLDVWLADNEWFGLNVYCAVVANEGWNNQGANLISQRRHDTKSDICPSGRAEGE